MLLTGNKPEGFICDCIIIHFLYIVGKRHVFFLKNFRSANVRTMKSGCCLFYNNPVQNAMSWNLFCPGTSIIFCLSYVCLNWNRCMMLTSAGFNGLYPHSLAHQVVLVESGSISRHIHWLGGITSPDVSNLCFSVGIWCRERKKTLINKQILQKSLLIIFTTHSLTTDHLIKTLGSSYRDHMYTSPAYPDINKGIFTPTQRIKLMI